MKLWAIFLVSVLFHLTFGLNKNEPLDLSQACIVRFLQIKGQLEDSFQSPLASGDLCRVLLPLIYANHSEKLVLKLWETKSVKARCVFDKLKNSQFIDLELKHEIYSYTKHLTKNVKVRRIYEVMLSQRKLLLDAAKMCKSDRSYGGIFDEVLGIDSSPTLYQEHFCLIKYVVDNRFIGFIPSVHLNLKSININNFDCRSIIETKKRENEQKLLKAFQKNNYSRDAIDCILEKYKNENIFGWNLAKVMLTKLDIILKVRLAEDMKISNVLMQFNRKSTNCLFSFNWELFK